MSFFPGDPRPQQREVLELIERHWDEYDVFAVKAPVACGKSRIAITVARWRASLKKSAAIITPTNILQQQYLDDVPDMPTLWRKGLYTCEVCEGAEPCDRCMARYRAAAVKAKKARNVVINYYLYMAHRLFKDTLIADEAHQLIPMVQEMMAKKLWRFQYKYPNSVRTVGDLLRWIESTPASARDQKMRLLRDELTATAPTYLVHRTKERYRNVEPRDVLKLIPLDTSGAPPTLWPAHKVGKVVLMSATLSSKDLTMLGLGTRRVLELDVESPIPPANRPVIPLCSVNMAYRCQEESIPLLAGQLKKLLDEHQAKGVIHCTYAIADKLKTLLDNPRLMWYSREHKQEAYERFRALPPESGAVLVACGLSEGIDLPYDLGRWQVITKVPWPSLADPGIRAMKDADPDWYVWSAARVVLQASGRICRTPTDSGITYILDSGFNQIPRSMLPQWFVQSLQPVRSPRAHL